MKRISKHQHDKAVLSLNKLQQKKEHMPLADKEKKLEAELQKIISRDTLYEMEPMESRLDRLSLLLPITILVPLYEFYRDWKMEREYDWNMYFFYALWILLLVLIGSFSQAVFMIYFMIGIPFWFFYLFLPAFFLEKILKESLSDQIIEIGSSYRLWIHNNFEKFFKY
jgi:hypothetical protein